jgi:hypothetical protein
MTSTAAKIGISRPSWWPILICVLLLTIFAVTSFTAVLTKNATIDEPTHALSGWLELRTGDFRLELVNPPLWKCWAAIGNLFSTPQIKHDSPVWKDLTWEPVDELAWTARTLYDTPGYDGDAFVNRSRAMMLVLGVALGAVIAGWSYRLSGPVAAIVATACFSLDPNFIANSPLVKSDVALALVIAGLAWCIWSLGRCATLGKTVFLGVLCGAAVGCKFSGVIVGPIVAVLLLFRALHGSNWPVGRWSANSRASRLGVSLLIGFTAAAICIVFMWGMYAFRFGPSPSSAVRINMPAIYARTAVVETTLAVMHHATDEEIARHPESLTTRVVHLADEHHLLPQALLGGFLYQRDCTLSWPAFLDGMLYGDGRWYYFPLSMLYKTPIATLAAFAASALIGCFWIFRPKPVEENTANRNSGTGWTCACVLVPFAIFAMAAMSTHLNIGMRSVLPLYPFLYICVGGAAAWMWAQRPRLTATVFSLLVILLTTETLSAWPDYIAFFNSAVGGESGGILHLADSNLDWGQDIKSLAAWQRCHPPTPLFCDYDGTLDPHFYGLTYHPISVNSGGQLVSDIPVINGLLAIRATHLQGLYIKPEAIPFYDWLRSQSPVGVVGGTIYIYRFSASEYERAINGGHP